MLMSWIFTAIVFLSLTVSMALGRGAQLASAVLKGAQEGVALAISLAGSLCLWSALGHLWEQTGVSGFLARLLKPLLKRLFPDTRQDPQLARKLSGNICANLLGLGNAATPMGIQAAQHLASRCGGIASDPLCRLIVLNTASIQLIPTTVAALRSSLGSAQPFSILPAVWLTSLCSAAMGLGAAWLFGRLWRR